MSSFTKFMDTDAGRAAADPKLIDRLKQAGVRIDTQTALATFVRSRWPDDYGDHWRFESGTPFGRAATRKLWSAYLAWKEAVPEAAAPMSGGEKLKGVA